MPGYKDGLYFPSMSLYCGCFKMATPGSPAGAVFQDPHLSWLRLATWKTGMQNTGKMDKKAEGRGGWGMTMSTRTENQDLSGSGRQPEPTSKLLPLNLAPLACLPHGPQPHPCFCWLLRPFSDSTIQSLEKKAGSRNQCPSLALQAHKTLPTTF